MVEIVKALSTCFARKQKAVLATILTVDGSVYQREGVRCLIQDDGEIVGIVSGGCVEKDLFEHAKGVMASNVPKQIEYDFRKSDDAIWGFGLGCNGAMTIWLQPFDPAGNRDEAVRILSIFERRLHTRKRYFCGTVIESEDSRVVPVGKMFEFEEDYMSSLFESGEVANMMLEGDVDNICVQMFAEHIEPRSILLIYGAGPDAKLLVDLAKFAGWVVVIADHRPHFINAIGFENADEIIVLERDAYGTLSVDKNTFVIAMTHNYSFDKQILSRVLKTDVPYVGQLGPKARIERLLADMESDGLRVDESCLEKLHAPIGLDIGATSPSEIALSIMAEALSRKHACSGGPLRAKIGPLHKGDHKRGRGFIAHG